MTRAALNLEGLPDSTLTRAEFLAALRAGLVRRIGASRDGTIVQYELTHAGRVLLGRARDCHVHTCVAVGVSAPRKQVGTRRYRSERDSR